MDDEQKNQILHLDLNVDLIYQIYGPRILHRPYIQPMPIYRAIGNEG